MDDKTIVEMYWRRDEGAIAVTAEKYGAYCLSISGNILKNREDAEECVNDAYLKTWNSIPTNRPEQLSAYIGRIVRNLSFNLYSKNRAEKRGSGQLEAVLDELSELTVDPSTPEDLLDSRLISETVSFFLSMLPPEKRRLFVRRYWYCDSIKDIAERCGMSENNVSVSLARLRAKLRVCLTERGVEL